MVSDFTLLHQYAQQRDAEAFNELNARYAGLVYGTCLRVLGNPADAEDVAQECFLELARKAGAIHTSLPGWLHALARSRSIDLVRREATRRRCEQQAAGQHIEPSSWAELEPYIDNALAELPDDLRQPILLHYLLGHTQAEAAARLDTTQATVSRRLEKGIEALRARLHKAGIIAPVALLATLLSQHAATAVPATLAAALGKMAVSGVGDSMVSVPAAPEIALAGKFAAGLAVVAVLLGGGIYLMPRLHALRAVFLKPAASRAATPAPPVATTPSTAITAVDWQASLPNGTRVTVAGVTIPPMDKYRWWAPDGTPLAQNPVPQADEGVLHGGNADDLYRRVAFRLTGVPERAEPSFTARWMVGGSMNEFSSSSLAMERGYALFDLRRNADHSFDRTTTIFLGIAESPWITQQITNCSDGVFTNTLAPDPAHAVTVHNIGPYPSGYTSTCQVTVTHSHELREQEAVRLLAFDARGNSYTAWAISGEGFTPADPPAPWKLRYIFRDITPEQIVKLQFETRPYTWLEFADVALEPATRQSQ